MVTLPALALLASLQVATPAPQPANGAPGPVGLCVRWGADPEHVSDAVVVTSSGNPAIDERVRSNTKSVRLLRPSAPGYKGQWKGMLVATSPVRPKIPAPSCAQLNGMN
jgi:hypothetical protein